MPIEKKIIIFDLDGVLINSIKNMELAWRLTSKKFNLNINFDEYKKYIGLPFFQILKNLKIKKKHRSIKRSYDYLSNKNLSLIKMYPGIKKVLFNLKKKHFLTAIITSKDKKRTNKIISKFGLSFEHVYSPSKKYKPKPHPKQILKILRKEKIKKKNCYYVGDMNLDAEFAKRAGVKFVLAMYGYELKKNKSKYKIFNFKTLSKII